MPPEDPRHVLPVLRSCTQRHGDGESHSHARPKHSQLADCTRSTRLAKAERNSSALSDMQCSSSPKELRHPAPYAFSVRCPYTSFSLPHTKKSALPAPFKTVQTINAPAEAKLYGKPVAGGQPLNVSIGGAQGRETNLLREVSKVWVGKHWYVPK